MLTLWAYPRLFIFNTFCFSSFFSFLCLRLVFQVSFHFFSLGHFLWLKRAMSSAFSSRWLNPLLFFLPYAILCCRPHTTQGFIAYHSPFYFPCIYHMNSVQNLSPFMFLIIIFTTVEPILCTHIWQVIPTYIGPSAHFFTSRSSCALDWSYTLYPLMFLSISIKLSYPLSYLHENMLLKRQK